MKSFALRSNMLNAGKGINPAALASCIPNVLWLPSQKAPRMKLDKEGKSKLSDVVCIGMQAWTKRGKICLTADSFFDFSAAASPP